MKIACLKVPPRGVNWLVSWKFRFNTLWLFLQNSNVSNSSEALLDLKWSCSSHLGNHKSSLLFSPRFLLVIYCSLYVDLIAFFLCKQNKLIQFSFALWWECVLVWKCDYTNVTIIWYIWLRTIVSYLSPCFEHNSFNCIYYDTLTFSAWGIRVTSGMWRLVSLSIAA